ncbi:type II 3-dehydroquinate dehydratase [bacterium]|nr:type II 3-dehydroquinate dehydratase [bacterium]
MKILLLNGPNLNMLGIREPEKYGSVSLKDIESELYEQAKSLNVEIEAYQSNHEGELIDKVQSSMGKVDGIIINAGGLTHTSVSLRDAISSVAIPTVEVHMTNIHAREEFRHTSLISGVSVGQVVGFGKNSYKYALEGIVSWLNSNK